MKSEGEKNFEAPAIMFWKKKENVVRWVFIIYLSFSVLGGELQLGKFFRWHFKCKRKAEKDFVCVLWRKTRKKRLRILIPNFLFFLRLQDTEDAKGKRIQEKRENYHTRLFQACENIIPLCFERSMCLLCFSHLGKSEESSSRNLNVDGKRWKREFFRSTEKCYLFLWENENVSQRTRYTALRLSFGLWFASSFIFIPFRGFSVRHEMKEGIKALSR